jgi:hypothetical protein
MSKPLYNIGGWTKRSTSNTKKRPQQPTVMFKPKWTNEQFATPRMPLRKYRASEKIYI